MITILVAEDDKATSKLMCALLKQNGYHTVCAFDGEEALQIMEEVHVDLLLSDVMMPKLDGYSLAEAIRDSGSMMPVLMLTAKDFPEDKRRGFLAGTDDYMTKPPDWQELILRIKALLRRARISEDESITIGGTVLDKGNHSVTVSGVNEVIPKKEFDLLYMLLSFPERTFTRVQILDAIWGMESDSDEKTVTVHINRLRSRYEDNPDFEIETVRGVGYRGKLNGNESEN